VYPVWLRKPLLGLLFVWAGWNATAEAEAQLTNVDIIDTALWPWITDNDTVNKTLYTRLGFEVLMDEARLISRKRGYKLKAGRDVYYLFVFRTKKVTLNGYPLKPATITTYRQVPINQRPPRQRPIGADSAGTDTAEVVNPRNLPPKERRAYKKAERAKKKAARKARRSRGTAPTDSTNTRTDGVPTPPDALPPPQSGGGESPTTEPTPTDSTATGKRKRKKKPKKPRKRRNRNVAADSTATDSAGTITLTQGGEPPAEPQFRTEAETKDLYMYFCVISQRRKLRGNTAKFWSRAIFLKGIVDRLDSLPQFREQAQQEYHELDSLQMSFFGMRRDQISLADQKKIKAQQNEWLAAHQRVKLYEALRKYRRRKRKIIKKFFLGEYFVATNQNFNIRPMPYALPRVTYLRMAPPQQQTSNRDTAVYFRFGITFFKPQKQQRPPKVRYTNQVQTEPLPLGQEYVQDGGTEDGGRRNRRGRSQRTSTRPPRANRNDGGGNRSSNATPEPGTTRPERQREAPESNRPNRRERSTDDVPDSSAVPPD
jgi:hypothetical protein